MGRFDALTRLDNKTAPQSSPLIRETIQHPENLIKGNPETQKSGNQENLKAIFPDSPKTGNPESSFSGKPENQNTRIPGNQKAEKYSTQLDPTLIKQIKQRALEQDVKDYEIVQMAIKEYLAKKHSFPEIRKT